MSIKSVLCLLWFSLLVTELYSSAIPMWEFLSKQEKVSLQKNLPRYYVNMTKNGNRKLYFNKDNLILTN